VEASETFQRFRTLVEEMAGKGELQMKYLEEAAVAKG